MIYRIDPDNPIFVDLRSICVKTFGIAEVVREELAAHRDRITVAFIFGSIAAGRERANSDVDLIVVGDMDVFELGEPIQRMQQAFGRVVDLNLYTASEWERLESDRVVDAIKKAPQIVIWDKS